ncbi:clavesin-2-like [Haematobia irritans]|uniref:clavesin-2-like n=1 Tax=Haematobia irritans TaxID=7368 RepID=UPI003F506629
MANIKPLPDDLQEIAIRELGEVPTRIPEDLDNLKKWIEQQPHLKACTDDQFLIQFLRYSKYSLEKAKRKIDLFYTLKTKYPDLFVTYDVDDSLFRKKHNTKSCVLLPTPLNDNGPRIIYLHANYGPDDFTASVISRYMFTLLETALLNDPYACIHGFIFFVDNSKALVTHFTNMVTPSLISKIYTFLAKAFPIQIKRVYFYNISPMVEKLARVMLPYVPEKSRSWIVLVGSNIEDLNNYIPQKYLPQDCGGENGSVENLCHDYNKILDYYREYFRRSSQYGTDEHLRCTEICENIEEFGADGSFRKINID